MKIAMKTALTVAAVGLVGPLMVLSAGSAEAAMPKCHGKTPTIVGTAKGETIRGTRKADVIVGLDGNDTIYGLGGNDTICGGPGGDTLIGGKGHDILHGDAAGTTASGGGSDIVLGGPGNDQVFGDHATRDRGYRTARDGDFLAGGRGNDLITATSTYSSEGYVSSNPTAISYSSAAGPVSVNLAKGRATGADGTDRIRVPQKVGEVVVVGSRFNDRLVGSKRLGSNNSESFYGGPGGDTVIGRAGFTNFYESPEDFGLLPKVSWYGLGGKYQALKPGLRNVYRAANGAYLVPSGGGGIFVGKGRSYVDTGANRYTMTFHRRAEVNAMGRGFHGTMDFRVRGTYTMYRPTGSVGSYDPATGKVVLDGEVSAILKGQVSFSDIEEY